MPLFKIKSKEERFIAKEMKKLAEKTSRTVRIGEYAGTLALCRQAFTQTITSERLNALERRRKYLSDAVQKTLIHDSVVGLLAVEEAEYELRSVQNIQNLETAQKDLYRVLRKLYRINHYLTLKGRAVRDSLGMEFDDTNEPVTFSDRAELIDEKFVEEIIQGATLEECLKKVASGSTIGSTRGGMEYGGGMGGIDFSHPGRDYNRDDDMEMLRNDDEQQQ